MTLPGPSEGLATAVEPRAVMDFLAANPTFLDQHPDLLRQLSIPHGSGEAVSLLERQVVVLREDNARLRQQLDSLLRHARSNEQLTRKIHALVLTLMNAVGPQAVFASLERGLCADFGADRVTSLVFAPSAAVDAQELAAFVGVESPLRAAFDALLIAGASVCGPLAPDQARAVAEDFQGSAVIMPLKGRGWDGVVICASTDLQRYSADMGTELLDYLREVATLVIDPWVKRSPRP